MNLQGLWNIKNANELAYVLSSYLINFAYHSDKIENDGIKYNDVKEQNYEFLDKLTDINDKTLWLYGIFSC